MIRVFLIVVPNWKESKNFLKYLNQGSAQALPRIPFAALYSLKDISTPYIGLYENRNNSINAGSSMRYSPQFLRMRSHRPALFVSFLLCAFTFRPPPMIGLNFCQCCIFVIVNNYILASYLEIVKN